MGSLVCYRLSEQLQCPCHGPGWQQGLISAAEVAPDTQAASGKGQCSLKDLQSLTHHSEGQHQAPKIRLPPPNLGTSKNRLICVFLSPSPTGTARHPETSREPLCSQAGWSTPAAPSERNPNLPLSQAGKEELLSISGRESPPGPAGA